LWSGLPILTCPGRALASRYGASLLSAAGLPELIAPNPRAYKRLAIQIGKNPGWSNALRAKLAANKSSAPLFDMPRFVADLERAFERVVERRRAGLDPDHIVLE